MTTTEKSRPLYVAPIFAALFLFAMGLAAAGYFGIEQLIYSRLPDSKVTPALIDTVRLLMYGIPLGTAGFALLALVLTRRWPLSRWSLTGLAWATVLVAAGMRFVRPWEALNNISRPDGVHFCATAWSLLTHGSFLVPTGGVDLPPRTLPGVSFIMALSQWWNPDHFGWGVYGILACSWLTIALAGWCGARLGGRRAGWLAALLVALSPAFGFYSCRLMSEIPWALWVLAAAGVAVLGPAWLPNQFLAGMLVGSALLFKGGHWLIAAGFILYYLAQVAKPLAPDMGGRRGRASQVLLAFLTGLAVGAVPLLLYNRFVLGGWLVTPYHLYQPAWSHLDTALSVKYLWTPPAYKAFLGNLPYYLLTFFGLDPRPERMAWIPPAAAFFVAAGLYRWRKRPALTQLQTRFLLLTACLTLLYGGAVLLYSYQEVRFFIPLFPVWFVAAAILTLPLAERIGAPARRLWLALALVLTLGVAAGLLGTALASQRVPDQKLYKRVAATLRTMDVLVTDEDPVLLASYGIRPPVTELIAFRMPEELWFPADPESLWRTTGALVTTVPNTLAQTCARMCAGKKIGVWIRGPHWRPGAYQAFTNAFEIRERPESGVPGFGEITGVRKKS